MRSILEMLQSMVLHAVWLLLTILLLAQETTMHIAALISSKWDAATSIIKQLYRRQQLPPAPANHPTTKTTDIDY